jgi:hypothetical protein
MTFPYLLKLLCLCAACFFLLHTILAVAAWTLSPAVICLAERMKPPRATRLLLSLRLFPAASTLLLVLGLCVPSYLWLEPAAIRERLSIAFLTAALLGAIGWAASIARALRAVGNSIRFTRQCRSLGWKTRLPGHASPLLVVEGESPLLALAGVLRPRIVISRGVLSALSVAQLEAALRHERAHGTSRDNLKRLLLLLSPDVFPFAGGFATLDRAWSRLSEWAADDCAREGNALHSLALAEALVYVARLGASPSRSPLLTSLVASGQDLAARGARLLCAVPPQDAPLGRIDALIGSAFVLMAVFVLAAMLGPSSLSSVHLLLEHLMH